MLSRPVAAQVVAALAPFLPQGVDGLTDQLQSKGGNLARELWARLAPKTEARPALKEAVADAKAQPDDEDARAALRVQVRKLLSDDAGLLADLRQTLERVATPG